MPSGLSVVIPTYDRVRRLERVLRALEDQVDPGDRVEVVVVSDGSTDGTDAFLTGSAFRIEVRPVLQSNRGPAAARNAGIDAARGELVVFVDDDVIATPTLLRTHRRAHERYGPEAVVIGTMLRPPDQEMAPWVEWEHAMLAKQYEAMEAGRWAPTHRQFYTGNASVRREHLVACGGFDTGYRRSEDVELAHRLARRGLSFHFEREAAAHHHAERSYRAWLDIARDYGTNDATMSHDGQEWIVPAKRRELDQQHPLVRRTVGAVLSTPVRGLVLALTERSGAAVRIARPDAVRRGLLSTVYALRYYDALARGIGGWHTFLASTPESPPAARDDADATGPPRRWPIASVVIPAHDEAEVIERCLGSLSAGAGRGELDVIVVANGCSDDTASLARRAMPDARVVELERASKVDALNTGDAACRVSPRVYLDADVRIDVAALRALVSVLEDDRLRCAAPRMAVELDGRPWYVRAFYRAFLELPYVSRGLVGNGVYALSAAGRARFDRFPPLTADDLFVRNLFTEDERAVTPDHHFCMYPPRRWAGLVAIRRRVYRGNEEYLAAGHRSAAAPTRSVRSLAGVALRHPIGLAVYLAVNAFARATRHRQAGSWERDDSGRAPADGGARR